MEDKNTTEEMWEVGIGFTNDPNIIVTICKGTKDFTHDLYDSIKELEPNDGYSISHDNGSKTFIMMQHVAIMCLDKIKTRDIDYPL